MLRRLFKRIHFPNVFYALARGRVALFNRLRRRFKDLDYVAIRLPDSLPALPEERDFIRSRLFGKPPLSLYDLDQVFERIGDDPRPRGVLLYISSLTLSLTDLQTLRGSIQRLRARGKRVICYAQGYSMGQYYIASACDEIILQPGGELATVGLRQQQLFLKDSLSALGVALDVIAISPYKGAYDALSRDDISPEGRQQAEWLLDSRFDMLLKGFAEGRGWTLEKARQLIDDSPLLDTDALAQGYVDAVVNDEGLLKHLGTDHIVMWGKARRRLFLTPPKQTGDKVIAMLTVSGLMMPGESAKPPLELPVPLPLFGDERAGDVTVVRQVRGLMKRDDVGAVLLFIDSGGGAAITGEAMTSALEELAKQVPLVVFMNSVAASGGYYIATPARWIVAQPGTITGSIGVVAAKPITGGLYDLLRAHPVEFARGANAMIYSELTPFTDAQRAKMRGSIEHIYQQFIGRVAASRHMTTQAVDDIGGGRVWTGEQALTLGLVDALGDLKSALAKAREFGNLPADAKVEIIEGKGKSLPPMTAESLKPAAGLRYVADNLRAVANAQAQLLTLFQIKD